jgi:hypothetical protein
MKDKARIIENVKTLNDFIGERQLNVMTSALRGEEGDFFEAKIEEYAERVRNMHKTYEQDGKGDEAIVHLHYFHPNGFDWYITEKDMGDGTEDTTQYQAFGYADMGFPELGYISIAELAANNVELDLYWTPRTLGEVKRERGE